MQEIMALSGVKSVGLLTDVATHVALFQRDAENHLKVFAKDELIAAAELAAQAAAEAAAAETAAAEQDL